VTAAKLLLDKKFLPSGRRLELETSGNMGCVLKLAWEEMQTEEGASNGKEVWRRGRKPSG